jgi:hypothetical protein
VTAVSSAAARSTFDKDAFLKATKAVKQDVLREIFYAFAVHHCV